MLVRRLTNMEHITNWYHPDCNSYYELQSGWYQLVICLTFVRRVIPLGFWQISLVVFTTYILVSPDNYMSPEVAFVSMSVINILNFATSYLPIILGFAAQVSTSASRVFTLQACQIRDGRPVSQITQCTCPISHNNNDIIIIVFIAGFLSMYI